MARRCDRCNKEIGDIIKGSITITNQTGLPGNNNTTTETRTHDLCDNCSITLGKMYNALETNFYKAQKTDSKSFISKIRHWLNKED
jgi:hypothetical protein